MIRVKRVDHIGVAVNSIDEVVPTYSLLGLQVTEVEDLPARGLKIAFLPAGETEVELLESHRQDTSIARFLEKRGEGIHHICLAVEDIDAAVKELIEAGVKMIDQAPRRGSRGRKVAFIHPDSTHGALVELLEDL